MTPLLQFASRLASPSRFAPVLAVGALAVLVSGCGPSLGGVLDNALGGGICALIALVLAVVALVEVWQSARSTGGKVMWTLILLLVPYIGVAVYYFFARK